ncbi:hypothetical protein [Streptomyces sp. NPDC019224]|uniref:hypothetical protein n=1 Tax=Streptomyces sp. NPDC019224 TaxID=3154484 RepID=UPI0033F77732
MSESGMSVAPTTPLFSTERTFRVWRYGVGHSQLLLCSMPWGEHTDRLDLLFEDVHAMQLVTRYEALEIHAVDEPQFDRLYEQSGLPARWKRSQLIVKLKSGSGAGWVQCGRLTLERRKGAEQDPVDRSGPRDLLLSLRPADLRTRRAGSDPTAP